MKKIIKHILEYQEERGMTSDSITFADMIAETVILYPEALTDSKVLLGWINSSSGYHEEVMVLYKQEFVQYLKNKNFARKYIEQAIVYQDCKEALELHPEFLKAQWFAKVAVEKFFPDDFVKLHCQKWLNNRIFFDKNKKVFEFTRRMNLFSNIMKEDDYVEIVNTNSFVITDVPSEFITSSFLDKIKNLTNASKLIKRVYKKLPYEAQSSLSILNILSDCDYNNELTLIDADKLDEKTYLLILNILQGSDALFDLGDFIKKIMGKSWFNESIIYKTLDSFSMIYEKNGKLRGDDFGAGIYKDHPLQSALIALREKSPSIRFLLDSEAGLKYLQPVRKLNEVQTLEKIFSEIMQDYNPCYTKMILNNDLTDKNHSVLVKI